MKYVNEGVFELDLETLPALKILPRAISNKSAEVEVFIKSDNIFIFARDLAGNVNYIAQEKSRKIKMYGQKESKVRVTTKSSKGDEFGDVVEGNINDIILDSELEDVLNGLLVFSEEKGNDNEQVKDDNDGLVWENFNLDLSSEQNVEHSVGEQITYEDELCDDVEELYCRFSTSADLIKVFNMYKKVRISVTGKEIIVENTDELTKVKFARTKSYTELDKIESLTSNLEWEDFPVENVKSIVPAIEKIEPLRYKQSLSIIGDNLYTFSDTVAVETTSYKLSRNYRLNNEVLRVLKYAVGKNTDVKISMTENKGVALNIDNLIVIFGTMADTDSNLFDLTRGTLKRVPFIEEIDKKFTEKISMANNLFKSYNEINIETKDDLVIISNERMESVYVPKKRISNGKKMKIDIEKLLLAIKLSGSDSPTIALFKINKNKAVLVLEGMVRVLIDTNEYIENN